MSRHKHAGENEKRHVKEMILDIKRYFDNEEEELHTNQQTIGIRALFRGAVVKEWVAVNEDNINYHVCNRILVQKCVRYYHECWVERCEVSHTEEKQKEVLEEEIKNMKEEANNGTIKGFKNFIDLCKINEKEEKVFKMKSWRIGCRRFVKNAPKIVHRTISGWLKRDRNKEC